MTLEGNPWGLADTQGKLLGGVSEHLGTLWGGGCIISSEGKIGEVALETSVVGLKNWRKSWMKMEGFEETKCLRRKGNRCWIVSEV